jgi:hypothetical protein
VSTQVSGDVPQQNKHTGNADDVEYDEWLARIQARFSALLGSNTPVFRTDAVGLFDAYLAAFPADQRQFHTCFACQHFVNRYGDLVVIDENGAARPALWTHHEAPELYRLPVREMTRLIYQAKVTAPFYHSEVRLGTPVTGVWHHLSVTIPFGHPAKHSSKVTTDGQAMAAKAEDFRTVSRALAEWKTEHLKQAVTLLKAGTLPRSEKVLGPAEWLYKLQVARKDIKNRDIHDNLVWRAVAMAPEGFCHPRSGMLGTLLDDIAAGKSFDAIKRAFGVKMDPLAYQRPQAAPSEGTIAQAEKLFEQLELAPALRRRFARVEEIDALWRPDAPKPAAAARGGIFGHLKPKGAPEPGKPMLVPAITITWEKFRRTVLPEAASIEYMVPSRGGFCAITTASNPSAPPLFQYDREEQRNPFSVYVYTNTSPSSAEEWGLTHDSWTKVVALTLRPSHWFGGEDRYPHLSKGVIMLLEGAKDSQKGGLAIFPELLRSELHGVRSVLEAFSQSGQLEGREESGLACGMLLSGSVAKWGDEAVRVTDRAGSVLTYKLDRWD